MDTLLTILLNWIIPVTLLVLALTTFYLYVTRPYTTWSKLGVPGPKPLPLVGNGKAFNEKGLSVFPEWSRQYGDLCGIYFGQIPVLLTTDLDIIEHVLVKDFGNFTHREVISNTLLPPLVKDTVGFTTEDERFWRQRRTFSPFLTANKLKMMNQVVKRCCHNLVKAIETSTEKGKALYVKRLFGAYTIDVIAGTGFGLETDTLLSDSTELADNIMVILSSLQIATVPVSLAQAFPGLIPVMKLLGFHGIQVKEVHFVAGVIRSIMEEKRHSGKISPDILTRMLEAEIDEEQAAKNPDKKGMTSEEIVALGTILFVAGYDTTATTLQYLSQFLALNPERQEKLYQEIVTVIGDEEPTYDTVANMPYLDGCLRETARLHPPAPMNDRLARKSCTIKGVTIPAGASVMVSTAAVLRDEKYFPQPDKFIPERFQDDSHPIPKLLRDLMFGAGRRKCIGMRLALFEAKMAVASALRKFRFVEIKGTADEITSAPGAFVDTATTKVVIGSERR